MEKDPTFFQHKPETTGSTTFFNRSAKQIRDSFVGKFSTKNIRQYCLEAAASRNKMLLNAALEFLGKHIADAEIANDPFLQFCQQITPSDFLNLARSVSDQDIIALFRQTLCSHHDFSALECIAD